MTTSYLDLILDYRLQNEQLNREIANVTPDAITFQSLG
jgi:hypothetical protein